MTDNAKPPELDPAYRKSLEDARYGSQMFRWARAGRKLTERKRAEVLAELELDVLWDDLTEIEREKAVKDVAEDRDFPGLFDRIAAEHAQSDRETQTRLDEVAAQIAKASAENAEHARKLAEQRAQADEEDRKAAEAQEAAARKAQEANRKQLLKERDKLAAEGWSKGESTTGHDPHAVVRRRVGAGVPGPAGTSRAGRSVREHAAPHDRPPAPGPGDSPCSMSR